MIRNMFVLISVDLTCLRCDIIVMLRSWWCTAEEQSWFSEGSPTIDCDLLKYQVCIDRNSGKITFTPRLALPGEFNQRLVQGLIQKLRHLHFRLMFWSDGILYLSLCWMIIANCWCFNLNSIGLGLKSRRDHQIWIWMYITSGREPAERIKRNVRKIQKGFCW